MTRTAEVAIAANNGDIGGGEVMQLNIARAMREMGIAVTVVGPRQPSDLLSHARREGFAAVRIAGATRPAYMAALARWRAGRLRMPLWCNGLVPSMATAGMGPRIMHLHTLPTGTHRAAQWIGHVGADRVIVPSAAMAGRIRGSEVFENWTEAIPYAPRTPGSGRPLRVGFLGRLTQEKGVDTLALAFARHVLPVLPDARLVLAGENRFGSSEDDVVIGQAIAPIADSVERIGWIARRDFFSQIDLAVFPSTFFETFGLVVAEAMASGMPFVISDAGALPSVAGSEHPWVTRQRDVDDLGRTVLRALQDLGSQEDLERRAAARRRWETRYSPASGHRRVADLLISLSEGGAA